MKINAMTLFASAGIGELHLHKGNLNFVAANELLTKRADTYSFFYPNTKMFQGDITNVQLKNEMINYGIKNNVRFLLATPPCQGLSSVGKNKHQEHFIEDKRNYLVTEVFDFIDNMDLDYILIENVPRFL
ncbi:DNA cytosine methyltransferase, partial [Erysipelothrix anatis]